MIEAEHLCMSLRGVQNTTKPVTSMAALGVRASLDEVGAKLAVHFARIFDCEMLEETPALAALLTRK